MSVPIPAELPAKLHAIETEIGALRHNLLTRADAVQLLQQVVNLLLGRALEDGRNHRISLQGIEDRQYDMLRLLTANPALTDRHPEPLRVETAHPVAFASADHTHPRGTKADNTRSPRFVARCEAIFGHKISHMDLGCAGGGPVWDFHVAGHRSIGIEGSDFSLREKRAFWSLIPDRLFTADITRPFRVTNTDGTPNAFQVITAWEVLEHIHEVDLPALFANIREALTPDGLFVASVATFEDRDPDSGAVWHVTIKSRDWWAEQLAASGLIALPVPPFTHRDYVRGTGNPRAWDWDAAQRPEMGFDIVARRAPGWPSTPG